MESGILRILCKVNVKLFGLLKYITLLRNDHVTCCPPIKKQELGIKSCYAGSNFTGSEERT